MRTSKNYTTIKSLLPKNYYEYKLGQKWFYYHPIMNTSTYQNNLIVIPKKMDNVTVHKYKKTIITYGLEMDLKRCKFSHKLYFETIKFMEEFTQIQYLINTLIQFILPKDAKALPSSNLGFIVTK